MLQHASVSLQKSYKDDALFEGWLKKKTLLEVAVMLSLPKYGGQASALNPSTELRVTSLAVASGSLAEDPEAI
jgi:hypothetical protein